MKKQLFLLAAMLLVVISVSLTTCGDDNDEPSGDDIVGTWECDISRTLIAK